MIRMGVTDGTGRAVVILGLSEENLKRLCDDKPILLRLDEIHPSLKADLLIYSGTTEYEMTEKLAILIGPNTKLGPPPTSAEDILKERSR